MHKDKWTTAMGAIRSIHSGQTVMIGGFGGTGTAHNLIDALLQTDIHDLTVICNDGGFPTKGIGKWIADRRVRTLIATHVGNNPLVTDQVNEGFLTLQLHPQGIFAEKIRAGGAGLLGILVEERWATPGATFVHELGGYFEHSLTADVALIGAQTADNAGNLVYLQTERNHNPMMAMAAHTSIAEVRVHESNMLDPEQIITPGCWIQQLVLRGDH